MLLPILCMLFADLTGPWVVSRQMPDGRSADTQYNFKQEGTSLSGSVLSQMGEQKIAAGKVEGDSFWFETIANFMGQERRVKYEGKIEGDTLKLTMSGGPGPGMGGPGGPGGPPPGVNKGPGGGPGGPGGGGRGMPREMVARRGVSAAIQKQLEADARRPKPVLPTAKALAPNGLAQTPPMGWNSWNLFRANISDKLIREVADAMVTSGMKDAGYLYLNIDDGWQGERDGQGVLQPNSRFPDMKALSDYVHSKGLKLGIYSSPGPRTCGQFEGSYGYEELDAKTWAAWGFDYLKYDWCSAARVFPISDQQRVYQKMGEHLRATGRPMVYALCQYGANKVEDWGVAVGGNLWRTTGDIRAAWASVVQIGFGQNGREKDAGPGHWNDPDMLEVGNPGLNAEESRAHFSLWALLASPLLAGNDVRAMTPEIHDILLNKEVIAVNQDRLGKQGWRVAQDGEAEVWAKPLSNGRWAVGLFNKGDAARSVSVKWADLKWSGTPKVRDLWKHADLGKVATGHTAEVGPHGVVLLELKK